MKKQLTQNDKIKVFEQLVERDGGFRCFYCKKSFDEKTSILEHLNNNRNDNRLDNLVLSCQSCNIKKIDVTTLQDLAYEKLEMNENKIFVREKDLKKIASEKSQEGSKEIDINIKNSDITKKFISDRVDLGGFVEFKDALDSCVYFCKTITGHGSHQSVRNYIAALTSSVSPFEIIKNEHKKKIIVRRN